MSRLSLKQDIAVPRIVFLRSALEKCLTAREVYPVMFGLGYALKLSFILPRTVYILFKNTITT